MHPGAEPGPGVRSQGGAAGGGYAQVVPMDEINLHFTGDFHAITSAHNLLSAMLDNHMHQGNALGLDPRRITWPRTMDMNDRALRSMVISLGGINAGPVREERFVIVPGSEIMAILALATDLADLETRLGRIIVGLTRDRKPVTAADLKASGAMTLLLKDAILPNLVQTLEGGPALVHCGPFGNIAHGCNSIVGDSAGSSLGDIVLTEAGFGADLGAEKFFDIKARFGQPQARGRRRGRHSPRAEDERWGKEGSARQGGCRRAEAGDGQSRGPRQKRAEVRRARGGGAQSVHLRYRGGAARRCSDAAKGWGARAALSDVWAKGGAGGEAVAREILAVLDEKKAAFKPLYDASKPIKEKIETIAREIYGAVGWTTPLRPRRTLLSVRPWAWVRRPVCIAKTQYSFSDDPTKLGRPTGFRLTIRDVYPSAGAGFVVALAGDIMTMPGLPKVPAAEAIRVLPDGTIEGLF